MGGHLTEMEAIQNNSEKKNKERKKEKRKNR